ncbi:hypothetical protein EG68_01047 [Paragonimus skrjabini miyazakii]|uniref:Uncharacterized protein n=1 Tax=Paragonimus skrjabini miyazakii TaxID=59628 RepID=A0A8S9Z877_9TREM|nr:hypothetical protein EG68_01047 [Paragonimus skrjabini miyazakii]
MIDEGTTSTCSKCAVQGNNQPLLAIRGHAGRNTNNPLTDVIRRRAKEYDDDLVGYGLTHDTFGTGNQTMFVDLANKNGAALETQFLQGLGSGAARSILVNRGDVNAGCVNLANDLNMEHEYLKGCLLYAPACEYGITWAVWLQFLSLNMETKEILIGTGET